MGPSRPKTVLGLKVPPNIGLSRRCGLSKSPSPLVPIGDRPHARSASAPRRQAVHTPSGVAPCRCTQRVRDSVARSPCPSNGPPRHRNGRRRVGATNSPRDSLSRSRRATRLRNQHPLP